MKNSTSLESSKIHTQRAYTEIAKHLAQAKFAQAVSSLSAAKDQDLLLKNTTDGQSFTLLHHACLALKNFSPKHTEVCLDIICSLYAEHGLVDTLNNRTLSPFMLAAATEYPSIVYQRLAPYINYSLSDATGKHILYYFAVLNQTTAMEATLANLDPKTRKQAIAFQYKTNTPSLLMYCTSMQHLDLTKILINYGAKILMPNSSDPSALVWALRSCNGDFSTFNYLLTLVDASSLDKHITTINGSLLHIAAELGYKDIASTLLEKGLSPDNQDGQEHLPVHFAMLNNHTEVACLLLHHMQTFHTFTPDGKTLMHYASDMQSPKTLKTLLGIVPKFFQTAIIQNNAYTEIPYPLIHTIRANRIAHSILMIRSGHPLNIYTTQSPVFCPWLQTGATPDFGILTPNPAVNVNKNVLTGWTLLMEAINLRNPHLVEALIEYGIRINHATDNGITALHIAVAYCQDNPKIIQLLLEKGALPNTKTIDGFASPLSISIRKKSTHITQMLLRHGANPNLSCNAVTPLQYTYQNDDSISTMLLLQYGAQVDTLINKINRKSEYENALDTLNQPASVLDNANDKDMFSLLLAHGLLKKNLVSKDKEKLGEVLSFISVYQIQDNIILQNWGNFAAMYLQKSCYHYACLRADSMPDIAAASSMQNKEYKKYNLDFLIDYNKVINKALSIGFIDDLKDDLSSAINKEKPGLVICSIDLFIKRILLSPTLEGTPLQVETLRELPDLKWLEASLRLKNEVLYTRTEFISDFREIFWELLIAFTRDYITKKYPGKENKPTPICFQHAWHYIFTFHAPSPSIFEKLVHSLTLSLDTLTSAEQHESEAAVAIPVPFSLMVDTPNQSEQNALTPSYSNILTLQSMASFIETNISQIIRDSEDDYFIDVRLLLRYFILTLPHTPLSFERLPVLDQITTLVDSHMPFLFDYDDWQRSYLSVLLKFLQNNTFFTRQDSRLSEKHLANIERCPSAFNQLDIKAYETLYQFMQAYSSSLQPLTRNLLHVGIGLYRAGKRDAAYYFILQQAETDRLVSEMSDKHVSLLHEYEQFHKEHQEKQSASVVAKLQHDKFSQEEKITKQKQKITNQKDEIHRVKEINKTLNTKNDQLQEKNRDLARSLTEKDQTIAQHIHVIDVHEKNITGLQHKLQESQQREQDLETSFRSNLHKHDLLVAKYDELQKSLTSLESRQKDTQAQLNQKNVEYKENLQSLQNRYTKKQSQNTKLQEEKSLLQQRLDALKEENISIEKLTAENQRLQEALTTQAMQKKQIDDLNTDNQRLLERLTYYEKEFPLLSDKLTSLNGQTPEGNDISIPSTDSETVYSSLQEPDKDISIGLDSHMNDSEFSSSSAIQDPSSYQPQYFITSDHPLFSFLSSISLVNQQLWYFIHHDEGYTQISQKLGEPSTALLQQYFNQPQHLSSNLLPSLMLQSYIFEKSTMPISLVQNFNTLIPVLEQLAACLKDQPYTTEIGLCGQQALFWMILTFNQTVMTNCPHDDIDLYCMVPQQEIDTIKSHIQSHLLSILQPLGYRLQPAKPTVSRAFSVLYDQQIIDIHVFPSEKNLLLTDSFLRWDLDALNTSEQEHRFSCSFMQISSAKSLFLRGQPLKHQILTNFETPSLYWTMSSCIKLSPYFQTLFNNTISIDNFLDAGLEKSGYIRRAPHKNWQDFFSSLHQFAVSEYASSFWNIIQKPCAALYKRSILQFLWQIDKPLEGQHIAYFQQRIMPQRQPFHLKISTLLTFCAQYYPFTSMPTAIALTSEDGLRLKIDFHQYPVLQVQPPSRQDNQLVSHAVEEWEQHANNLRLSTAKNTLFNQHSQYYGPNSHKKNP